VKKDFLSISDLKREEIFEIVQYGLHLKEHKFSDRTLDKKSIGMIFMKPSTRTRISFEVGIYQMGGQPIYIQGSSTQISRGEDIKDTARVLSRYLDGLVIRTFSHKEIEDMAHYSDIPVINALTDLHHPCQILSDIMTIKEYFGKLEGLKLAYIGDGNNMANSWLLGAPLSELNLSVATPQGYEPNGKAVAEGLKLADRYNTHLEITNNPEEAVKDADIIYTDVWVSMGQEGEKDKIKDFEGFQIDSNLLSKTGKKDTIVMHCLPAHKGEEITEDIFEKFSDIIFTQAENRLHAQKALMSFLYK